jgi:hypothetical protein
MDWREEVKAVIDGEMGLKGKPVREKTRAVCEAVHEALEENGKLLKGFLYKHHPQGREPEGKSFVSNSSHYRYDDCYCAYDNVQVYFDGPGSNRLVSVDSMLISFGIIPTDRLAKAVMVSPSHCAPDQEGMTTISSFRSASQ